MQTNEDQLKKRFAELANRSELQCRPVFSDFLTVDEQSFLLHTFHPDNVVLYGGHPAAERKAACFGCRDTAQAEALCPIRCIRIFPIAPKFADTLSHRDFLGTLMGLGIRRETVGDIVLHENCGYIFCLEKIAAYILENTDRVRHTSVKCELAASLPESSMALPEPQTIIVASERLDALVAAVYKLSRASAQALFIQNRVFINGSQTKNSAYTAKENDIISVRGFGRFIFCTVCGETKKSRLKVSVQIF